MALSKAGSPTALTLRESGKFLIIGGSDNYMLTDILYFYTAAVVVLSAALGIMLFRFVSSKAKSNIYFSLGISRAGLFSAHWLTGAAMLEAAVLLPLAVSAILNLAYFGSSVMLWRALLFYAVIAFAPYNVVVHYILLFISYFAYINAVLAVFNLVPIPPLDGSKILASFLSDRARFIFYQYQNILAMVGMILIVSGALTGPLSMIESAVYGGVSWLASLPFRLFGVL